MKSGLIVYSSVDHQRNQWFIDKCLLMLNDEQINLFYLDEEKLLSYLNQHDVGFVIYRGRDYRLLKVLETKGIKTYNNALTNQVANDKYQTYLFLKENGFPVIESYKDSHSINAYPYIMKSVSGHGGQEVFLINNEKEKEKIVKENPSLSFIYQEYLPNDGDVRIYVLNKEVVAAVKRKNPSDYRNNYSLGGSVSLYPLSDEIKTAAVHISELLNADYIGLDFLLTKDGYLFNEIEDPVGCRMLYQISNIDIVKMFLEFVRNDLLKR